MTGPAGGADAPLSEVASTLQRVLTRRLTAYVAGLDEDQLVGHWSSGEGADIRDPLVEQRLRAAYAIARTLLDADSAPTVRAWFIGRSPLLDDGSPAEAIREGNAGAALAAARAFRATA